MPKHQVVLGNCDELADNGHHKIKGLREPESLELVILVFSEDKGHG